MSSRRPRDPDVLYATAGGKFFPVVHPRRGLPGQDGLELLRRLRRGEAGGGQTTPAIALTAYASSEDRERALAAGFDRHIAKPADPVAVARAVAALTLRPIP